MRSLPTLVTRAGTFCLPLCHSTAAALMGVLLADETRRVARLKAAIFEDPVLCLWTLCRTGDASPRPTMLDVARSLDLVIGEFSTALGVSDADKMIVQESGQLWARRVSTAIVTAELAASIATSAGLDAERAYLLGMLSQAKEWLTSAVVLGSDDDVFGAIPADLRQELAQLEASNGSAVQQPADCVACALRLQSDPSAEQWSAVEGDQRSLAARQEAIRQRWLATCPASDGLPALVRKLARLTQLENEFARTLEHEKLESLKQLAYGASHEINNPLANISARAQTLLREERDPERRRKLAAINTQALRAHEMISDMMLFARPPRPRMETIELAGLVGRLIEELAPAAGAQNTQLLFHAQSKDVRVAADSTQIAVALRALCTNALEALVTGGRVDLTLSTSEVPASCQLQEARQIAVISVADTGPGISAETRRHIFDPFFSGREAGRGLGFGLPKCWRIVEVHGGQIETQNRSEGGACFTIRLPALAES